MGYLPNRKLLPENLAATDDLGEIGAGRGGEVELLRLAGGGGSGLYDRAEDIADNDCFGLICLRKGDSDGAGGGVGVDFYWGCGFVYGFYGGGGGDFADTRIKTVSYI